MPTMRLQFRTSSRVLGFVTRPPISSLQLPLISAGCGRLFVRSDSTKASTDPIHNRAESETARATASTNAANNDSAWSHDIRAEVEAAPVISDIRHPRNVQALYLKPLRREAKYGIPSCDLQLRSYSVPNLEFFADFALRAAYYLGLPAFGPVPLPRITERWTVTRSTFIFKKAQENFERITMRRLIQIRDGNPDTVQIWLAFLQKHAYYGIGMKANVWEFSALGVGKSMSQLNDTDMDVMDKAWSYLGQHRTLGDKERISAMLREGRKKAIYMP
jgi:small subunit ribosomal protein S10